MRILVTGCAGFIGSHLSQALLNKGHRVVGIDNLTSGGFADNIPSGVSFYEIDCNDLPQLRDAMKACEIVFHTAATPHEGLSVVSPHENSINGYAASMATLSAAISNKVRRFVNFSSMARYGTQNTLPFTEDMTPKPQDPYGIGKYAFEQVLKVMAAVHSMEFVVAVPHNVIGPKQHYFDPFRNVASIFINLMLQGRQPYIYGNGSQERCFSYITDVIDPIVKLGFADNVVGETINIGPDDEVITILELCKMIAKLLDFKLEPIFTKGRPQEVHIAHCSADKARKLLDYNPQVKLEDGLKEMIAWIKTRGIKPFKYHLNLEIENERTPATWKNRLF